VGRGYARSCFFPQLCAVEFRCLTKAECEGSGIGEMIGGGVMAIGKEEVGEVEVTAEAEAVTRWEVEWDWKSCLRTRGRPSWKKLGMEREGDEDAGVLMLEIMGVMGALFNASVTGAVQTQLLPLELWSLTTQKRVPPSPNPRPISRHRRVHSHIYPRPHIHPPANLG
jgi:hypothetical protein